MAEELNETLKQLDTGFEIIKNDLLRNEKEFNTKMMEFYTKIIKIIQEEKYRMSGRLDEMSLTTQTMTEMLQEALSKNSKESKDVLDKLTPVFTTGMNTLKLHKEKIDALQSLEDDFKQKKGTLESVLEAKGGAKKGRKKSSNVKATSKKPRK